MNYILKFSLELVIVILFQLYFKTLNFENFLVNLIQMYDFIVVISILNEKSKKIYGIH